MLKNVRKEERYISLGDSYTIGESISPSESYPVLLTNHLKSSGINITLIANPSISGFTTQNLIDHELPILTSLNPSFVTLLIGANDFFQGVDQNTFKNNLEIILDKVQEKLPKKNNIILITIPDFSVTPYGKSLGNTQKLSSGIADFNSIIKKEGEKSHLKVVDIYPLTQKMENDPSLVADDLHPSEKEYALWEKMIYKVAYELLAK